MQHVVGDFLPGELRVARMSDAQPQAPESGVAELRDDVLESVVSRGAATELEFHAARLEVELIMRDEHLGERNAVIAGERGDWLAALVHVALRQRQPEIAAVGRAAASHQTREPCFGSKLE